MQDESGNATSLNPFEDPMMIVNMSVWVSIEVLFAFVYQTGHTAIMRQRKTWFETPAEAHMALWWIAAGTPPSAQEGKDRLLHLRAHGPGPFAFSFKRRFAPPAIAA